MLRVRDISLALQLIALVAIALGCSKGANLRGPGGERDSESDSALGASLCDATAARSGQNDANGVAPVPINGSNLSGLQPSCPRPGDGDIPPAGYLVNLENHAAPKCEVPVKNISSLRYVVHCYSRVIINGNPVLARGVAADHSLLWNSLKIDAKDRTIDTGGHIVTVVSANQLEVVYTLTDVDLASSTISNSLTVRQDSTGKSSTKDSAGIDIDASTVGPLCVGGNSRSVNSMVNDGTNWFLGGSFSTIGRCTGGGAPVDKDTGTLAYGYFKYPRIESNGGAGSPYPGSVSTVVSDGSGGWFFAGNFTHVGGQPRNKMAHMLGNGTVTDWNPNPDTSSVIRTMVLSGNQLYVGGYFNSIGGQARTNIASLDPVTGNATAWKLTGSSDGQIWAIAVAKDAVYVGGDFKTIGGQVRGHGAAIDSAGHLLPWDPKASATCNGAGGFVECGRITALATSEETVYIGGSFTSLRAVPRQYLGAVDAATGAVTSWNPNNSYAEVNSIILGEGIVYCGGHFSGNHGLRAVDRNGSLIAALEGSLPSGVNALALQGNILYAVGGFSEVAGQPRHGAAAVDVTTGDLTSWNPDAGIVGVESVKAMAAYGEQVFIGGSFSIVGGHPRDNLAALDSAGNVLSWNPKSNGEVLALAISGSTVTAGGSFTNLGGKTRNNIGGISTKTHEVTAWNPNANGVVTTLVLNSELSYIGGAFTTIGGQARARLAAIDSSGAATAWDPNPDNSVKTMAVLGSTVFVGGTFANIGGQPRQQLAAIDQSGNATDWNPSPVNGNTVMSLQAKDHSVYVTGNYTSIGGQEQAGFAGIDTVSGLATSWNPHCQDAPRFLTLHGERIFASNCSIYLPAAQTSIDGMKSLDLVTGARNNFRLGNDGFSNVTSLSLLNNKMLVAGMSSLSGELCSVGLVDATSGAPLW